jgi:hypothetical protein
MCFELFSDCEHDLFIFPDFSLDVFSKSGKFCQPLVSEQNLRQEPKNVQSKDLALHALHGVIGGLEFAGQSSPLQSSGELQWLAECTSAVSDIDSISWVC